MNTLPKEIIDNLKTRRITNNDLVLLKSLPDYHEIDDIYFFDDYFVQSGHYIVEISNTEKIFSLGDILGLTSSYRFVYVNKKNICILIDAFGREFSIYFCSLELLENIDFIKKIFSYALVKFGWDFNKNYNFSHDELNFTFIENRDKYFDI